MEEQSHSQHADRAGSPPFGEQSASTEKAEANQIKSKPKPNRGFHSYPFYAPRFWHGMLPKTWFKLLASSGFKVHPTRFPLAFGVTATTPFNATLAAIQKLLFSGKLQSAEMQGPPVFIVGHWRSGTTLLHELMVKDERLSSPSTYQCFSPHHFLVSEWFFRRFCGWLLPGKRPIDNMATGWDRPQEDEFALLTLGLPSPYRRMAFPNQEPVDSDYLDFDSVSPEAIQQWLDALRQFLLGVSVSTQRPLIIKSPTHTGRVGWLAKEFPDAKFIHISRDPRSIFPSTCRLWQGLDEVQALQQPNHQGIEDYVIHCLKRMYRAFHEQRKTIDPSRIIDVRYEDLTAAPVKTLEGIYGDLRLGDFDSVRPLIEAWVENEHRSYQTNQHRLPPEQENRIRDAWSEYFETYQYV